MKILKVCMLAVLLMTSISCTSKDYASCRPNKAGYIVMEEIIQKALKK